MVDMFSRDKRSRIMQAVKSKGNKSTEIKLIQFFKATSITGWRRGYKLIGKPDFVFTKLKIAIFVDGCFWHGHSCRNLNPSTNSDYWSNKIKRNKKRDQKVTNELIKKGWTVYRIWECDLKEKKFPQQLIALLKK